MRNLRGLFSQEKTFNITDIIKDNEETMTMLIKNQVFFKQINEKRLQTGDLQMIVPGSIKTATCEKYHGP